MIKDSDWTKEYCQTTHKVFEGNQYSVTKYGNFAQLQVYSWVTGKLIKELYFFVQAFDPKTCENEPVRFWNCGTIERAVKLAKIYAEGSDNFVMNLSKDNMSKLSRQFDY